MEDNFRSSKEDFFKAELDVAIGQNARLLEENALLHQKLENLTIEQRSNSSVHIEAKLKAFRLEEERDRMYEKLERVKRKYNQLHEAYIQKVKRCKALEDVFSRQKTLNGLVMKSAIDQKQKEQEGRFYGSHCKDLEIRSKDSLEAQLAKLQNALDEAHDIIDELEFELESVDFLEVENQRLQNELEAYKREKLNLRSNITGNHPDECEQRDSKDTTGVSYDELPVYREKDEISLEYNYDSNASSLVDSIVGDIDPATMERAVLTESLIKTVESESNCLRRELLRSRLQNATRVVNRPTSSDV